MGSRAPQCSSGRFNAAAIPLPENIDTPAVRDAWKEWATYRRSIRKPITEIAAAKQIAELATLSPAEVIEAINTAIKSDWRGLFPKSRSKDDSKNAHNKGSSHDSIARNPNAGNI